MLNSKLHDEKTFYQTFLQDLEKCKDEVIIESPYITSKRMRTFDRIFKKLLKRKVKISIITRDPKEHESGMEIQSENAMQWCETAGIQVLLCIGNHHRKLAILDRKILWEGSLKLLTMGKRYIKVYRRSVLSLLSYRLFLQILNKYI